MFRSNSDKLTKLSTLGRTRFVLLYGVLGWGVPTAILFALVQGYLDGWDGLLLKLMMALVLFPLGGIAWGLFMWKMQQLMRGNAASLGDIE